MILTALVDFGAFVMAAAVAALLAPEEIAVERPFLPSQCMARLTPIAGLFGNGMPNLRPRRDAAARTTLRSRIHIRRHAAEAVPPGGTGWPGQAPPC